ncbi:hypothetical protein [Oceanobacillus kimchii]|uniref:hypothetical protein n=1 Tax=Oceanobacillus kimchii TaxID=746691 RepID=UPI0009867655|nr:hypothetical protein [Oceanobacillus kimchii]
MAQVGQLDGCIHKNEIEGGERDKQDSWLITPIILERDIAFKQYLLFQFYYLQNELRKRRSTK